MHKTVFAAVGLVMLAGGTAKADPKDYRFEAVQAALPASATTTIAVRLVHIPDGKPVTGAIVFQPKMEMPMTGMAPMATKIAPLAADAQGNYRFTADLSMVGPWVLSLSAKVQGEAATLSGSVPFTTTGETSLPY